MKRPPVHFAIACLALALTLAGYGLWYRSVSSLSVRAESLDETIVARHEAEQQIAAARTALSALSGSDTGVDAYFVAPENVVPFIETLQALGSNAGAVVAVTSVAQNAAASTSQLPTLSLSLTVTGSFSHVVRAVGALEYAPYDLKLSTLALADTGAGGWTATLTLTVGSTVGTAITPSAPGATTTTVAPAALPHAEGTSTASTPSL